MDKGADIHGTQKIDVQPAREIRKLPAHEYSPLRAVDLTVSVCWGNGLPRDEFLGL